MSKFKRGQKFTIEIAEVHTHYSDDGKPYSLYRVKGFNSLVLDDYALAKLKENSQMRLDDFGKAYDKGYKKGRTDEKAKLLELADCDHTECRECGMGDITGCLLKE